MSLLALVLASGLLPSEALGQKTDTLRVQNGGKIVGEIKELDRGQLRYKTDAMSTVQVDWEKVVSLQSDKYFEFELASGLREFGRIGPGPEDRTAMLILTDTVVVSLTQIVSIVPIRQTFWSRLDGYIDIGFDVLRANNTRTLNSSSQVTYRGEKWAGQLTGSTYMQTQDSANDVRRNNVSLVGTRILPGRWDIQAFLSAEQNNEIQLDYRLQAGGGAAYRLLHTHRQFATLLAGGAYSSERYTTSTDVTDSFELIGRAAYQAYRFHTPKLDVSTSLTGYASMTDLGRIRLNFDGRASYELIKDFTVGARVWDDFDSAPPGSDTSSNDYGLTFSLGYKF
ncbi:MAG: DUF481 domain-containing protein [Gemmatimonadetes bacterium]|nr:DUF481 domain-containing protein [Gemmatimonadota bacterium]